MSDGDEITEQWTLRYRVNGGEPQLGEEGGHVFDTREEAERHITAWQEWYPKQLKYSDVEYLRRQVITTPWVVDEGGTS